MAVEKQGSQLYDWQQQIINHEGNVTVRGGRQTGKSWAVAKRIVHLAYKYPKCRILVIAASERQENYLHEKVRAIIESGGKSRRDCYRARATLTKLPLKNGTDIYKFPVGMTGIYLEGLSSVDFLFADEAIHIGEKVWDSVMPMMLEPKKRGLGWITLISSTQGKAKGFFKKSFERKDFLKIQIKAADCPHVSLEFLAEEKQRLGERRFKVIYEGEFDEEAHKYFPSELIDKAVTIGHWGMKAYKKENNYYLGIDPARFGKSKAAFAVAEMENRKEVRIVYGEEIRKSSLTDLKKKTEELDNLLHVKKIFIDDGGVGAGLVDMLEEKFKRKLVPLNNARAVVGHDEEGKRKILKEDLYSNLLKLLETGKLKLINQKEVIEGLKAAEFDEEGKIRGSDMSEAIVRAAWCIKERHISPFVQTF